MPPSDRSSTSGSRTARSRSKSPSRAAARNASTTAHWPSRSTSGTGAPCTRRRPRLASWRVAVGRATDDRGDLVERHGEHVVQHERDAFGGRQRIEHDEQREPDRIAQQGLLLGIHARLGAHDRVRHVGLEGRLAPRPARPQHVEADPPDDRRQPGPQVLDLAGVRAAQADPRLLDGVVGLAHRAEHAECHAAQVGAVGLESLGEPVLVVHPVTFLRLVGSCR